MRFLFVWQRVAEGEQAQGVEGLAGVLAQLEGFETCAGSWEVDVLGRRVANYDPGLLDAVCLAGRVTWARISPRARSAAPLRGPLPATPIAFLDRSRIDVWLRAGEEPAANGTASVLSSHGRAVHDVLEARGASFFPELVSASGLLPTRVEETLGELVAAGLATADSFTGLRALLVPSDRRKPLGPARQRGQRNRRGRSSVAFGVDSAGRWSLLRRDRRGREDRVGEEAIASSIARSLLRRYGVVFRRLLDNEPRTRPWWQLVRGAPPHGGEGRCEGRPFRGRGLRRAVRASRGGGPVAPHPSFGPSGKPVAVSAADPLNLTGVLTPGPRIAKSPRKPDRLP